jgi:hypothetical protein
METIKNQGLALNDAIAKLQSEGVSRSCQQDYRILF